MLRKLCKYELMASGRTYLVGYGATLALALLTGLFVTLKVIDGVVAGSMIAYVLVIWVMLVLALVQSISRFKKNLLQGEGYLMHTLPVSTWQLILSKLLTGLLLMVGTVVVAAVSVGIMACVISVGEFGFSVFRDIWSGVVQALTNFGNYNGMPGWLTILWICVISLLGYADFLLTAYAGMAVGQLFSKGRDGIAVAVFFALVVAEELIATGGGRLIVTTPAGQSLVSGMPEVMAYGGATVWLLVLCAFHFFLAERLLSKRLNLE